MDLAHETTTLAWIVDRLLEFARRTIGITPVEQVAVADLDLSAITNAVDPVVVRAQVPLEADPPVHVRLPLNDVGLRVTRGADGVCRGKPLPAGGTEWTIRETAIDL